MISNRHATGQAKQALFALQRRSPGASICVSFGAGGAAPPAPPPPPSSGTVGIGAGTTIGIDQGGQLGVQ